MYVTASQLYELTNVMQVLQFGQVVSGSHQGHKEIKHKIEN